MNNQGISFFERYLTVWVLICIVVGVLIGKFLPIIPNTLKNFEYYNVSLPIAVLIWMMIFPMMLKIDFNSLSDVVKQPKGLTVTVVTNWLIKPFTMYAIAYFFFTYVFKDFISADLSAEYIAGAILLGAAPCTAMVFVWSYLTKGNASYTLVQVALNDIIILIAFAPIVAILLGVNDIEVPYETLFLSVFLFVIVPFTSAYFVRKRVIKIKSLNYFNDIFVPKFSNITILGLLTTLVIIFSFQGSVILNNPSHILLISIPLIIQTLFIFFVAYLWARLWHLKHNIAAPAGLIGSSNFFELAVAVAISLFGLESGATLVTVVGVLVEVPVMLMLVKFANKTSHWFDYK
tara:strand:+ start:476 stop:1516 length:1041 start_codon:yes stop_codon:yes gene_type:complete